MSERKAMVSRGRIAFFLIFCAFIGMRVIHIRADAPSDLDFSAGIYTDEMHNVHQVRNKILFGSWTLDRYPSLAYSPMFGMLQYGILSIVGVGLVQIKILPILLSLFSLLLVYQSLDAHFGKPYGLAAFILLGFNYTFLMFNRLGLYENLVIFFMCLALFFWQRALAFRKPCLFFGFGFISGCVFMSKTLYLFFVVAAVLSMGFYFLRERYPDRTRNLLSGLAGLGGAGIAWYSAFYLPFREGLTVLGSSWMKQNIGPQNLLEALRVNPVFPLFLRFRILPVTLTLAAGFLAVFCYRFLKSPRETDPMEFFIALWFLGGMAFLGLLSYGPTRYYLPVLPPTVLLATVGITRFGYGMDTVESVFKDFRFYAVWAFASFFLAFYLAIPYIQKYFPYKAALFRVMGPEAVSPWMISAGIAVFVVLVVGAFERLKDLHLWMGKASAVFFALVFLGAAIWMSHPGNARIEVDLSSEKDGYLQVFWAGKEGPYSEAASRKIRTRKGRVVYRLMIDDISFIERFRIDPLEQPGKAVLHRIAIRQPGYAPLFFNPENRFSGLKPVHEISESHLEEDGLALVSSGTDPHLAAGMVPDFKNGLLILFMAKCAALAGIAVALLIGIRQKILPLLFSPEGHLIRKRLAWLCVGIVLWANFSLYLKWVLKPDYSIWNTTREVGKIVPSGALIAGVGVMMATIENRIRHLHAPYWFEDPKTLFQVYPITHLFVSPYAGYLNWYRIHYPKVMEYAKVLSTYHIGGRDFFLFELDVPDDEKESAFRYR